MVATRPGGFEGLVAEAIKASYRGGENRSRAWLTVKNSRRKESHHHWLVDGRGTCSSSNLHYCRRH